MGVNETITTIVGTVISKVNERQTTDGVNLARFRVRSTERRYDNQTGQWGDGEQLFVNVTCWKRLADGVVASLAMGDPVVVTGRLYTRSYEAEGQAKFSVELTAVSVGPDLTRCVATLARNRRQADRPDSTPLDTARAAEGLDASVDADSSAAAEAGSGTARHAARQTAAEVAA
ncbi:single-stranded DNA-binding protein [Solihabitans fulvus]|nr:single-stranded DNA-binding protein [Solihabitans fulvus]